MTTSADAGPAAVYAGLHGRSVAWRPVRLESRWADAVPLGARPSRAALTG